MDDNIDAVLECNRTLDSIDEFIGYMPRDTQNTTVLSSLPELNHYVNITCLDSANNTGSSQTTLFKIDTIPPATTDNATNEWKASNQTILLSCSDGGSGCNTTMYCIDNETNDCDTNITGNIINFGCPEDSVCTGYIRYQSNDTAGNYESVKNTTLIKIDRTLPSITGCTSIPETIDNDTKASSTIEISCIVNSSASGIQYIYLKSDQPYNTTLNTTEMTTFLCTAPAPDKYCAFVQPDSITDIGKIYFHVNATNNLNNSNYQENATISIINDLSIIYNSTSTRPVYYSLQDISPLADIYFAENKSIVSSGTASFELRNSTDDIENSSNTQISSGQANASFYIGCINETETMYLNTSAEYGVLNEYNISQQFNVSPLLTATSCWFSQISGKIDIYCSYNDTVNRKYIDNATLILNVSLGGTCDSENVIMDYSPITHIYNYSCIPPVGSKYCSIPLIVAGSKECHNPAIYNESATTTIGVNVNAYFIPDNIHTMEHSTLWMNLTSTESDANGVNVTISQTGGATIYGPWNIIENNYTIGTLIKDMPRTVTSDISVPSREQTANYSLDVIVTWNNTNCNGIKIVQPQLKILDSYYVDFVDTGMNKHKFEPRDMLTIDGTLQNIGNVEVSGDLTASIHNLLDENVGTLSCNTTAITLPFDTSKSFRCLWNVSGPERGITTGDYKVRLRFDSPSVSLLHEEDISIIVSEQIPKNKNIYVIRYPVTVIDRYGRTSERIIKIYSWME